MSKELAKQILDAKEQEQIMKYYEKIKENFCKLHVSNPKPDSCEKCKIMMSNTEAIRMLAYINITLRGKDF